MAGLPLFSCMLRLRLKAKDKNPFSTSVLYFLSCHELSLLWVVNAPSSSANGQ